MKKTPESPRSNNVLSDAPVETLNEDRLDFYGGATNLLSRIIDSPEYYEKRALCIGLIAAWGSGKTSFLNLMQYAVEKDESCQYYDKAVIVKFNPWFSKNFDKIIYDFMNVLSNELSRYNPNISSELLYYSRILSKADLGWFSRFLNLFSGNREENIENQFAKLSKCIKGINKPVIVFIDDLDRLQADEIMGVLQLVRNTANFPNTVFVVPFDKDYVVHALSCIHVREEYLEKIFTTPYYLPYVSEEKKRILISEILSSALLANEDEKIAIDLFLADIGVSFSIREIIRLSNQLAFAKPFLSSVGLQDIYLYDLLLIEYLHLYFKEVYDRLPLGENSILSEKGYLIKMKNTESNSWNLTSFGEIYLNGIADQNLRDRIIRILLLLFGENTKKDSKPYRLKYKDIFDIYFRNNTDPETVVLQSDFDDALLKDSEEFKETFTEWFKTKNRNLLIRLFESVEFKDEESAEQLLKKSLCLISESPLDRDNSLLFFVGYKYLFSANSYYMRYNKLMGGFLNNYENSDLLTLNKKFRLLNHVHDSDIFRHINVGEVSSNYESLYICYLKRHLLLIGDFSFFEPAYIYFLENLNDTNSAISKVMIKEFISNNLPSFFDRIKTINDLENKFFILNVFRKNNTVYFSKNNDLIQYKKFLNSQSDEIKNLDCFKEHMAMING